LGAALARLGLALVLGAALARLGVALVLGVALARVGAFLALTVFAALFFAVTFFVVRLLRPGLEATFLVVVRLTVFLTFCLFVADFLAIKSCPPENF
jgi:hypothetical protein